MERSINIEARNMKSTPTSAGNTYESNCSQWITFLETHHFLVKKKFEWINWLVNKRYRRLEGKGNLVIDGQTYKIKILYSPYFSGSYDRIYITSPLIKYHDEIHVYRDLSLCLYHPVIDIPSSQIMPLYRILPWISEWIINYRKWQRYGIWFSDEIAHEPLR